MKILVINGPNLNMLGIREPDIYGRTTYADLLVMIKKEADVIGVDVEFMQSNHEGDIVDAIQAAYGNTDGIMSVCTGNEGKQQHDHKGQSGARFNHSGKAFIQAFSPL